MSIKIVHSWRKAATRGRGKFSHRTIILECLPEENMNVSIVASRPRLRDLSDPLFESRRVRWQRIAFPILIANIADHLLSHGLLHETGELRQLLPPSI